MGELDFKLRVNFAFLCFFAEDPDNKGATVLMRELRNPKRALSPRPSQPHYPLMRYEKSRRNDPPVTLKRIPKKTFRPPNGLPFGTANAVVAFENEDLQILPCGKAPVSEPYSANLTEVFDTSLLANADSSLNPDFLKADRSLVDSPALHDQLAGRLRIKSGKLFVDTAADALAAGMFSIFPLLADFTVKTNAHLQAGFRLSRSVAWEINVTPASKADRYVDFKFTKGSSETFVRLYPPPEADSTLEVHIRNCEEEEIDSPTLPTQYEDQIHRGELMACYPLLAGFKNNAKLFPQVKLAPYKMNGSGICAPLKSS